MLHYSSTTCTDYIDTNFAIGTYYQAAPESRSSLGGRAIPCGVSSAGWGMQGRSMGGCGLLSLRSRDSPWPNSLKVDVARGRAGHRRAGRRRSATRSAAAGAGRNGRRRREPRDRVAFLDGMVVDGRYSAPANQAAAWRRHGPPDGGSPGDSRGAPRAAPRAKQR